MYTFVTECLQKLGTLYNSVTYISVSYYTYFRILSEGDWWFNSLVSFPSNSIQKYIKGTD